MILKRLRTTHLATTIVCLMMIHWNPSSLTHAVPISKLLSIAPLSSLSSSISSISLQQQQQQQQQLSQQQQQLSQQQQQLHKSSGRVQIRRRRMEERPSSSSFVHSDAFTIDAWFISHQAAIDRQPQHPPALKRQLSPQQPVHSNIQQPSAPSTSSFDASIQQPLRPPWFDRTLEGHAVLDDEDDDAGNELLDTEADGLLRPDADDEINGTLEGQVLEEEEEEEEEEEDEEDVAGLEYGDDEDGSEGWREVIQRLSAAAAARSRQEG